MDALRGHHTIYLGMAAGVGKTYRMLLEGHAALEAGRDVVVGVLETHGRQATAAVAEGLPVVARRRVVHREITLDEMDLPAIMREKARFFVNILEDKYGFDRFYDWLFAGGARLLGGGLWVGGMAIVKGAKPPPRPVLPPANFTGPTDGEAS